MVDSIQNRSAPATLKSKFAHHGLDTLPQPGANGQSASIAMHKARTV